MVSLLLSQLALLQNQTHYFTSLNYYYLYPAGNPTVLIQNPNSSLSSNQKSLLCTLIRGLFKDVDQIGFFNSRELEMEGGELCGNALRCFAYILNRKRNSSIKVRSSGVSNKVLLGCREDQYFVQMAISIRTTKILPFMFVVSLEGISYLVLQSRFFNKKFSSLLLFFIKYLRIFISPAFGVVLFKKKDIKDMGSISISPLVYVKKANTTIFETSSVTSSLAVYSCINTIDEKSLSLYQPSGKALRVSKNKRLYIVSGDVKLISKGTIYI